MTPSLISEKALLCFIIFFWGKESSRMQRQIYVKRERGRPEGGQSLGFQLMVEPGFWAEGGSQPPRARLSEGRLYLFLFLTIRTKTSLLTTTTRNEMHSFHEVQCGPSLRGQSRQHHKMRNWSRWQPGDRKSPPLPAGSSCLKHPGAPFLLCALGTDFTVLVPKGLCIWTIDLCRP